MCLDSSKQDDLFEFSSDAFNYQKEIYSSQVDKHMKNVFVFYL